MSSCRNAMTTCCPISRASAQTSSTSRDRARVGDVQRLESERRLFYVALTRARKGVLIGTSQNPSRFLEEIQLDDTDAVMDAVTHLAAGDNTRLRR